MAERFAASARAQIRSFNVIALRALVVVVMHKLQDRMKRIDYHNMLQYSCETADIAYNSMNATAFQVIESGDGGIRTHKAGSQPNQRIPSPPCMPIPPHRR